MDKNIQSLYDFTPSDGERIRAIAYEKGFAIANDGQTSILYHCDYESALEGKSKDKWGDFSPHIDTVPIFKTINSFDLSEDDRWTFSYKRVNGIHYMMREGLKKRQMFVVKGEELIPFSQIDKLLSAMIEFEMNILYDTGSFLYFASDKIIGFTEYQTSEQCDGERAMWLTCLKYFPKLK